MMENTVLMEEEEDTQHGRYLTFLLGSEVFGLDISYVTGIVGLQPITPIPEAPEYVRGIMNLRGKVVPVVDLNIRFGRKPSEYNERTCIINIDIHDLSVGLVVDTVAEVLTIEDGNIVPPPDARTGMQQRFIKAIGLVGSDLKLLLDCERLFHNGELESIQNLL